MKGTIMKNAPKALVKIVKGVPKFCKHNSNWILSGLAILGVTGVTWAAIDGTIKAVKLCEEKQVSGAKEIIKTTWKLYIPAAGFFILTTVSILSNAHINAKRIATLTGLYAASQADLESLKKKAKEIVGIKKEKEIEAAADKEKLEKVGVPDEKDIAKTGHGNDLFMDGMTGQFFRANPDYIDAVEKELNMKLRSEVDGTVYRRFLHEKFNLQNCEVANMYWDYYDLTTNGTNEVKLDATYTGWVEINGKREMAAVVKCVPEATGY